MKKTTLFAILLSIGLSNNVAIADTGISPETAEKNHKIATIKRMYQQDVSSQGQNNPVVLQQYGSKDLQAAMQLEQDYFDKTQMSCHIGYDVLWDSQDPDYEQDKQFSMTKQGLVQVSLAQGSTVHYELVCNDSNCQIADVIVDEDGTSLKDYLNETCR